MSNCAICEKHELRLKEAVMEHWGAVRQYQDAVAGSGNLSAADAAVHITQIKMNQVEDAYRSHLRLMHGTAIEAGTPMTSTFSGLSTTKRSSASN
jgi:hypothetical protein